MTLEERLKFCTICTNRKVDFSTGLVCGLTDKKPDFEDSCPSFSKDEKEMERKLILGCLKFFGVFDRLRTGKRE